MFRFENENALSESSVTDNLEDEAGLVGTLKLGAYIVIVVKC